MSKFIFAYDAPSESYEKDDVRKLIIVFLNKKRASKINQLLATVFEFNSDKTREERFLLVKRKFSKDGGILQNGFFVLTQVYYKGGEYKILRNGNDSLQQKVDDILDELE